MSCRQTILAEIRLWAMVYRLLRRHTAWARADETREAQRRAFRRSLGLENPRRPPRPKRRPGRPSDAALEDFHAEVARCMDRLDGLQRSMRAPLSASEIAGLAAAEIAAEWGLGAAERARLAASLRTYFFTAPRPVD